MKKWISLLILLQIQNAKAMNLQEYLAKVQQQHRGIKSLDISKDAAEDRRVSGDSGLSPVLTLKGSLFDDKKQPGFLGQNEQKQNQYSLGLAKKFSSGTALSISATATENENLGIASTTTSAVYSKYSNGALGISATQSLWKDSFGKATRLRQQREGLVAAVEKSGYDLQERQTLTDAEAAYWDYIYLTEELKLRNASLERAKRIETWVSRRANDGIGDRADLLNAQALSASRKLQLIATQDELTAATKKIKDMLEISDSDEMPKLTGDIQASRALSSLVDGKGRVVRLDAHLSLLQSKTKSLVAQETEDAMKADLVLAGSYNTNSYDNKGTASDSLKNMTNTDAPTSAVSLTWTYLLDTDAKTATTSAVRKDALAAKLLSERKMIESESSWSEIQRRNSELSKKIEASSVIAKIQIERAKVEQEKLIKGRSVTSNVIQSEQDAADSELTLTKLKAEQRKLEAQARLYVGIEE